MRYFLFIICLVLISCTKKDALEERYELLSGGEIDMMQILSSNNLMVLVFLSPECPLCQNYAPELNRIELLNNPEDVFFVGIVSGNFYPREEILKYKLKYEIDFPIALDPEFKLANQLDAEITPEIVLLNPMGKTLYQGAIDNWAISLGKKRLKASSYYLEDALTNALAGNSIDPSKTKAVGCFIE